MTREDPTPSGWVRVGIDRLPRTLLIVLAIVLGGSVATQLLGDPVGGLTELVTGVRHPMLSLVIGAIVLGLLVAPLMLRRVPRAVDLDPARGLLRVGRRTVPVTELRRAWRTSTQLAWGPQARLRLELPRAADPVVVLSPQLGPGQLAALRAVVEAAPIEAPPDAPLVPPFEDELGDRGAERIADLIGLAMLDAVDAAYRKPTPLAELDALAAGRTRRPPVDAEALVATWLEEAEAASGRPSVRPEPAVVPPVVPTLFSMMGGRFRRRRAEVEDWLARATGGRTPDRHALRARIGLALVVVSFALPVAAAVSILSAASAALGDWAADLGASTAWVLLPAVLVVITAFAGPVLLAVGLGQWWDAGMRRLGSARSLAVGVAARGVRIPEGVATLLIAGKSLPRLQFARVMGWAFLGLIALALGLTFAAIGNGRSEELAPDVWMVPLGVLLVAVSVPALVRFYRVFAAEGPLRLRRAGLESDTLRLSAGLPVPRDDRSGVAS